MVKQVSKETSSAPPLDYTKREYGRFNAKTYKVDNLHFPADLMSPDNTYGSNYVIFYVNVQQESKIKLGNLGDQNTDVQLDGTPTKTMGARSDIKNQDISKTGTVVSTTAGAAIFAGTATLLAGGGVSTAIGNAEKAGLTAGAATGIIMGMSGTATRATKRLAAAIALHNPNQISVNYNSAWSGADTAKEQMAMFNFGASTPTGDVGSMLKSAMKAGGGVAGAAGNFILSNAPNKDSLSAMSGLAANPKKEMIFAGVDFRTFTFDYKFAPRNFTELELAQNIIKMFKFHMHPEFANNSGHYLYLYPSEFDILYYNSGEENKNMPRYTSCVLTNMTVNYTPSGYFAAFGNGAPIEINISLTFKELATLTKAEIADGY